MTYAFYGRFVPSALCIGYLTIKIGNDTRAGQEHRRERRESSTMTLHYRYNSLMAALEDGASVRIVTADPNSG
jgi:hypothetical protein